MAETLVIDRETRLETILSFIDATRKADVSKRGGDYILSPVINPADYDNDTDYLSAIPGMKEKLIASHNAPASEFSPMPDDWINRNV